jgi:predicted HicB family RNase H-like nuclease
MAPSRAKANRFAHQVPRSQPIASSRTCLCGHTSRTSIASNLRLSRWTLEQWVESAGYLDYQIELLSPTIGEPPEAAGEAVPAASLYIRLPTSLKVRIEEAAEADKLSVNAWAMRCMETCIARNKTMGE